ncbi:MAG: hypothetical protein J5509_06970 [Lachnospiraceae bacterium]|nr:hypothetical protein [Lachnospiraceae bacterium]
MEIIKQEEVGMPESVTLKLRPDDDNFDYRIYPAKTVEKTVALLTNSGIYFDLVPGDSEHFGMIPLVPSAFDNDELEQMDAVALMCQIDGADLDEAVRYINEHDDADRIIVMKRSELPEFMDLLDEEKVRGLSPEIREVLCIYMRNLLDMTDGDRMRSIIDFDEKNSFGRLLLCFSRAVQEFILNHVTNRFEQKLREDMMDK